MDNSRRHNLWVMFCKKFNTRRKPCTDKILIDGLVRYLSGNYSSNKWDDEYGCVNAIVTEDQTKIKKDINGLKFIGIGADAKWPVGDQVQNQRYYFPNHGFTLVATVRIDSNTSKKNSVLGIGLKSSNKNSIGVWCKDGK